MMQSARVAGLVAFQLLCASSCSVLRQSDASSTQLPLEDPAFVLEENDIEVARDDLDAVLTLASNPVELGRDDLDRLSILPRFEPIQIESLREYVRVFGAPINASELAAVEGFHTGVSEMLTPFIAYPLPERRDERTSGLNRRRRSDSHGVKRQSRATRMLFGMSFRPDVEARRGFQLEPDQGGFTGSRTGFRGRLQLRAGPHFRTTILTDHDPGEVVRLEPRSGRFGPDLVSTTLELRRLGPVELVLIGDHTVRVGYGLTLWTGPRRSSVTDARPAMLRTTGIRPKSGISEVGFLRGVAIRARIGAFAAIEAFSSKLRVATSSSSGLHRTRDEIDRGPVERRLVQGGKLWLGPRDMKIGVVVARTPRAQALNEARHEGNGSARVAAGFLGAVTGPTAGLEVEFSRGGWAVGGAVRPVSWLEIATLVNRYRPTPCRCSREEIGSAPVYSPGHGGTDPGWTASVRVSHSRWTFGAFQTLTLGSSFTNSILRPVIKSRLDGDLRWRGSSSSVQASLLLDRREQSGSVSTSSGMVRGVMEESSFRFRFSARFQALRSLALKLQGAGMLALSNQASGYTAAHELDWDPIGWLRLGIGLRVFDAAGLPMYGFEPDVFMQRTWLSLNGKGSRAFAIVRFGWKGVPEIQWKYGQTVYREVRDFGSGPDYLRTDRRRAISISLFLRR
jgi:hypothetical protein